MCAGEAINDLITNLAVFFTLIFVISRVSGMGSEAMTAARLFLTSGSLSTPLSEEKSETDKQRKGRVNDCKWLQLNDESKVTTIVCVCVCVCMSAFYPDHYTDCAAPAKVVLSPAVVFL